MRNANKSPKIPYSTMVREMENRSGIRIRDRIPQKLITSSGSRLAHAYHDWSTSVTAIVSCRPWSQNDHIIPPTLVE